MGYIYNKNEALTKTFDFVYGCAMHDAILQRAFNGKKDWVGKVEKSKVLLREYVDKVLENGFSSQKNHDAYFLKTVNAICKEINTKKPLEAEDSFSFGNAQKLINITIKHIYSFCYYNPELREKFRYCHCPLDSIMLNKVWKMYKDSFGGQKRKNELKDTKFFCRSWGNEGQEGNCQPELLEFPERYVKFQNAIKDIIGTDNLYSIEFDLLIWQ